MLCIFKTILKIKRKNIDFVFSQILHKYIISYNIYFLRNIEIYYYFYSYIKN